MTQTADPFFEPYDRKDIAYGDEPTAAIAAFLDQIRGGGRAIDLGAGAGRDTIALASAGYEVTAVDLSERGLERVRERAEAAGVSNFVTTKEADVRKVELTANSYDAIVATTVLDHIPSADAVELWKRMTAALTRTGMLFVEVHTTEDPGSPVRPGCDSEFAGQRNSGRGDQLFSPQSIGQLGRRSRLRTTDSEVRGTTRVGLHPRTRTLARQSHSASRSTRVLSRMVGSTRRLSANLKLACRIINRAFQPRTSSPS